MSNLSDRQILDEYLERFGSDRNLTRLRDPNFYKQNEILDDRANRYKALNATRRSGKTVTEAISFMEIGEEFPKSNMVFGALTLDSAADIVWQEFKDLNKRGSYGCKFNETKKIMFFPNGSKVRLFGLDTSPKQMRKVLGQKLRKFSLEEAGSMSQDMRKLFYQMVKPALADLRPNSWMTLLGTCENIPNTFFEGVTEGTETDLPWKVYKWTAQENPYMAKQWQEELDEMLKNNPKVVDASWFKTHYMNQWCADDDLLIIPIDKCEQVEFINDGNYDFVLGVDVGYNDANAFSILACHKNKREVIIVKTFKEAELIFSEVAEIIKGIQRKYNIFKIVIDGANKQGLMEIRKRFHIPMDIAEKTGKATYLHLLRDDVICGYVLMDEANCGELYTEWSSLMWKDLNKEKEDDRCQNHLADATLYAWRYCYHYLWEAPEQKLDESSDAFMDDLEEREALDLEKQERENQEGSFDMMDALA